MKKRVEEMTALQLLDVMDCISEYCYVKCCIDCPLNNHCRSVDGDPSEWNTGGLKRLVNEYIEEC